MRGQFDGHKVNLEKALPFLIHACYQQLRSLTYKEFLGHGLELTPEQWVVWSNSGKKTAKASPRSASAPCATAPTMSRILDTMEKSDLVTRVVDEHDARSAPGQADPHRQIPASQASAGSQKASRAPRARHPRARSRNDSPHAHPHARQPHLSARPHRRTLITRPYSCNDNNHQNQETQAMIQRQFPRFDETTAPPPPRDALGLQQARFRRNPRAPWRATPARR